MFGSSSQQSSAAIPAPPPIPEPPPNPPSFGSQRSRASGDMATRAPFGSGSTIMTQGLSAPANTTRKTLLGQ